MPQLRDDFKSRLKRRDPAVGLHVKIPSADLVAAVARRFDFIFIDCENGGPDAQTIPDLVRAAHAGGAVALLRPWSKETGLLRRYLGCGIDGFILPDMESADEIARVRALMRDVLPAEAAGLIVLALIETARGVENARAIMQADGVDAIQIGTSDLAVSLGLPRRNDHPQVKEIAFRLLEMAKALGMSAGTPVNAYPMTEVLAAGGTCVILFLHEILAAGIDTALKDWPRRG